MLLQRAIIALTLGPLALFLVYLGGLWYFVPLLVIIALATIEYTRMTRGLGWQTSQWVLIPVVVAQLLVGQWPDFNLGGLVMLLTLLVILAYALWLYERNLSPTAPADWMAMMGGMLLLGWLGSHFFRLRNLPEMAWQWTILALVTTWLADSGAYLVGKFMAGKVIGRHQLSPRLSPNKTVEGYVGGIVLGTSLTAVAAYILQLPLTTAVILGALVSVVSPLGDLGISLLKRTSGIKDSGHIFGEHGGALDRLDSLIWSMAMAYYLVLLFG